MSTVAAPPARLRPVLPRAIGAWSAAAVLVGSTIGSGIFRVPTEVALATGTVGGIALLWIGGAVIALCGALTLAELAVMMPSSGGIYVFIREAWGPLPAFLFGWTRLLVIQPAVLGAISLIFASYIGAFIPIDPGTQRIIAACLVVLLAAANCRSTRWGAAVQNISTAAKVITLAGLALLAFAFGEPAAGAFTDADWGIAGAAGFGGALVVIMWTYDGWADLTYMAGEVRDPQRVLPRALIGGTLAVVVIYLLVNAAYLYVMPVSDMSSSPLVAADAATRLFGTAGASIAAALVLVSTFGALNGTLMTGPRIFFALADDRLFFRSVARVHPKFETPFVAIAVAGVLGVCYLSVRSFEQLAEAFVLGVWPFYVLAVGAVFRMRRMAPEIHRPYRVPGYPVVPTIFLLASAWMLGDALVRDIVSTLSGFAIIGAGAPVYFFWRARRDAAGRPHSVDTPSRGP